MTRRRLVSSLFTILFLVPALLADEVRLPSTDPQGLAEIGRGKAIVFSPDLVVPGNRQFYERLGFLYLDSADWNLVIDSIERRTREGEAIDLVIVESHGTNGNGLKLQEGKKAEDGRSYIAAGALQEKLDRIGVPYALISACNAGRLFRPEIYSVLVPNLDEPLFLPATLGIVHASAGFEPAQTKTTLLRRKQSNLETLIEGSIAEFDPAARALLRRGPREGDGFVVSSMLIQLLLGDPELELTAEGYETTVSRADYSKEEREQMFARFLHYVNEVAAREHVAQSSIALTSTTPP
jgi:hypothetical protein